MIDLLKLFPFISLILTHPLEPISLANYKDPVSPIIFIDGSNYLSPYDGIVKEILEENGLYRITISFNNGNEAVYSGLSSILKKHGDKITQQETIGMDNTISPETQYILMFYEKTDLFPQFVSNKLTFYTEHSKRIYMVEDGIIIFYGFMDESTYPAINNITSEDSIPTHKSFIPINAGLFCQIKLIGRDTYISYLHLFYPYPRLGLALTQGDLIAYSGMTGDYITVPQLGLQIDDMEIGGNIRVIYYRK